MSRVLQTHFKEGDRAEVLKPDKDHTTLVYHPASVLLLPSTSQSSQIVVQYQTLTVESLPIKELVDLACVRPTPPRQPNECFKVNDNVDFYCDNGWDKALVKDILENSKYIVGFDGKSEGIVAEQCNLRLHCEWGDGSWLSTCHHQDDLEVKSRKIRLKVKCSNTGKRKAEPIFRKGMVVEVRSDDEGYQGSWFSAVIVDSMANDKFLVQYLNLVTDDETAPLRETVSAQQIRPSAPKVKSRAGFKLLERVDAWFNEGWWEGVVSRASNRFYTVYFSSTGDYLSFDHSMLRPHQEWIDGKWIKGGSIELQNHGRNRNKKFRKGTKVKVKSDEVGFQGTWFGATVVDVLGNDKFLVQYHNLLTEDETDCLIEEASASDVRPYPLYIQHVDPFKLLEIVDAWYNDGWWVGHIIRVKKEMRYRVQFKTTEELEFDHCELRPHQEWIDGNWLSVPQDWEF